jgi:CRP-like cAMP-binding protein
MKLEQYTRFDPAELVTLDRLLSYPRKTWARGETIIADGHKVGNIYLIVSGLAARSKSLPDGKRQLMAVLVPGDLCDVEVFVLEAMDHDIVAMSDTTCALLPAKVVEDLLTEHSNITKALWWSTMTDSAVLRQWIVGHGSRDARERLAHLFCELLIRHRIVGETTDETFAFPLTQEDLADATGMSTVHVNRVLQQLRAEGLIELKRKSLTILDPERLKSVAQFQANYLHLARTEQRDPEVSKRASDLVPPTHSKDSGEHSKR